MTKIFLNARITKLSCTLALATCVFLKVTLSDFHTISADIKLTLCVSDAEGHKLTSVSVTLCVTSSFFKGHLKDAESKSH